MVITQRRAQDMKEVIDKLQLAPVTLIGWSLGVVEILTYIEQFGTSTLRNIVLVDGDIGHDPIRSALPTFGRRQESIRLGVSNSPRILFTQCTGNRNLMPT
jgi:pimeloyl-ACP methyl ester carboxylesterase